MKTMTHNHTISRPFPEWKLNQKKHIARTEWYKGIDPQLIALRVDLPLETIQEWIKEFKPKKDIDRLIEQILNK